MNESTTSPPAPPTRDDNLLSDLLDDETHPQVETADPHTWEQALKALHSMFLENGGIVSSRGLRANLESLGIEDARTWVIRIRHFDFDEPDESLSKPPFRWHCHARSFYSEEAFDQLRRQQEQDAANAERVEGRLDAPEEVENAASPPERRKRRQEESRLGTYVANALEDVYLSEYGPDTKNVFDVHSERAGSDMENVDILAVDWRSSSVVELVAVEVKLDFTSRLVQQARNYQRFAHRVWIAVPVTSDPSEGSTWLRDTDPLLFEHVVECGLGIIACKRRQGGCYEAVPVHWPRRQEPDPVEKERFLDRYRTHFEEAGCLAPRSRQYPSL